MEDFKSSISNNTNGEKKTSYFETYLKNYPSITISKYTNITPAVMINFIYIQEFFREKKSLFIFKLHLFKKIFKILILLVPTL